MLIEDGLLDDQQTFGHYLPVFRGTVWEDVKIVDAMDMTPGIDCEENDETRADPDSIAIRVFLAEFGMPYKCKQENLVDVLRVAPLAHGIVSSTLRDMARFGMLYTPSWAKAADKQIVSDATLARIKGGFMGQALYVSPKRDLVIAFYSTRQDMTSIRYLRPIATSGLFDA